MSLVSELINVTYRDLTNYTEGVGNEALGVAFDYHWGPVNTLGLYNEASFFDAFPESLPKNLSSVDPQRYFAYAQIKKAFSVAPNLLVEAVRVQGSWKYNQFALVKDSVDTPPAVAFSETDTQFSLLNVSTNAVSIATKYPGYIPGTLLGDYDGIAVQVQVTTGNIIQIDVLGLTKVAEVPAGATTVSVPVDGTNVTYVVDTVNTIESWEGGINAQEIVDGQSFFIENVCSASEFISVKIADDIPNVHTYTSTLVPLPIKTQIATGPTETQYKAALDLFKENFQSSATLLINPIGNDAQVLNPVSGAFNTLNNYVISVAEQRQDLMGVIGMSVATQLSYDNVLTQFNALPKAKFAMYYAGKETVTVFGYTIASNCIGGICGRIVQVAYEIRTNQLPSAFTYGSYSTVLTSSLQFEEVNALHKLGAGSVFSTNSGPIIWNVRSLYKNKTSYFGKGNVMRVIAEILRQVFPIAINAVHTDAASNPVETTNYNVRFNSIIQDEISKQNLRDDSYATCLGAVNSDSATKGGEVFNVVLALHLMKLVEAINIRVYATDSTVTAEFI